MTKQTQLVFLNELKLIRLVCRQKDCQTIVEFPISKIGGSSIADGKCPGCGRQFRTGYQPNVSPLNVLANALRELQYMHENNFEVQFPLEEPEA